MLVRPELGFRGLGVTVEVSGLGFRLLWLTA